MNDDDTFIMMRWSLNLVMNRLCFWTFEKDLKQLYLKQGGRHRM